MISNDFLSTPEISLSELLLGVGIGKTTFTFSCCRFLVLRQDGQLPQISLLENSQFNICENLIAIPSLPHPGGPENKYALPTFSDIEICLTLSQTSF